MANPQVEDGYLKIANELFEAIYMHYDFTKRQLRVLSTIIRRSYGWNKPKCAMSLREISLETGIDYRHVSSTLQELISNSVLFVEGMSTEKRVYKLNKNYDEWRVTKTVTVVSPKRQHDSHQNGDTLVTKTATDTIKKQRKTKERQHAPAFLALWELFPEKKRLGLQWISEDVEQEVVGKIDTVRRALEEYLASVEDEKYLVKAEKFFSERMWEAYVSEEPERPKRGGFQ